MGGSFCLCRIDSVELVFVCQHICTSLSRCQQSAVYTHLFFLCFASRQHYLMTSMSCRVLIRHLLSARSVPPNMAADSVSVERAFRLLARVVLTRCQQPAVYTQ